jgi:hypothetical protein
MKVAKGISGYYAYAFRFGLYIAEHVSDLCVCVQSVFPVWDRAEGGELEPGGGRGPGPSFGFGRHGILLLPPPDPGRAAHHNQAGAVT